MARILIAEDDHRIAGFVERGLRAAGFTTTIVGDGRAAAEARIADFDLLVLDIGLPGQDGFEVLQAIRARDEWLPVIVLTARDDIRDRVRGLEDGADDYMVKPFSIEELVARVRTRLRDAVVANEDLAAGEVQVDHRTRRLVVAGRPVEVTAREFALAETFVRHAGQVLSREQLLDHVWGRDRDPVSNVVEVYVGSLRRKLGADRIETVRGTGYRLRVEAAQVTGRT
jgi:DNA-binding response OmpR family regulator